MKINWRSSGKKIYSVASYGVIRSICKEQAKWNEIRSAARNTNTDWGHLKQQMPTERKGNSYFYSEFRNRRNYIICAVFFISVFVSNSNSSSVTNKQFMSTTCARIPFMCILALAFEYGFVAVANLFGQFFYEIKAKRKVFGVLFFDCENWHFQWTDEPNSHIRQPLASIVLTRRFVNNEFFFTSGLIKTTMQKFT